MPIIVVTGKEIEKIKGDFESYLSGLNMVGEISYSQYSELYDEGTKQIQRAYELGKSELEKENAELKSENQKWKDEWQEQVQKATDEGYARTLQTMQLTKARDLLKKCYDKYGIYDVPLLKDIEQFISEVKK